MRAPGWCYEAFAVSGEPLDLSVDRLVEEDLLLPCACRLGMRGWCRVEWKIAVEVTMREVPQRLASPSEETPKKKNIASLFLVLN